MSEAGKLSLLKNFVFRGDSRTSRAKKNISVSFLCKAVSILVSFIIVPVTLGYVGTEEYGIWMTISSIISWFSFLDVGLGNGLRNKLAESLALNDIKSSKVYISSVFVMIALISALMFVGFYIASFFIPWNEVLNTKIVGNVELRRLIIMIFFFFCSGFITNVTSSVLQAMQKYALNDILNVVSQILGLLGVYILVNTTESSLYLMCLIYSAKTAVVMGIATLVLFYGKLKHLKPEWKYVRLREAKPLISLGLRFFINQILYLITTQTTVFIVAHYFGPGEVTVYNLALRYTTITSMLYMMVLMPYLSAFTEAFVKDEMDWIKKTIRKINFIWLLTSIVTVLMVFASGVFFHLWIGEAVVIPLGLISFLAFASIANNLMSTYSLFLNGIGKIRLQFYLLVIQAILYFPLTWLFYNLNLGIVSVVIPQVLFQLTCSVLMVAQYKKIVERRASGIWFK